MKKILILVLSAILCISMVACGEAASKESNDISQPADVSENVINIGEMTAGEIINLYVDAGYPISNVIIYDETNDTNNLLGRPNQYTSKINFADSRIEQYDINENPIGGSIEVFINADDAAARKKYIEDVTKSLPSAAQYLYLSDNVLLRIDFDLTPDQAKEYEDGFTAITNGEKPSYASAE